MLKLFRGLVHTDGQLKYETALVIPILFHQCFILFLMLAACKTSLVFVTFGLIAVYFFPVCMHMCFPFLWLQGLLCLVWLVIVK